MKFKIKKLKIILLYRFFIEVYSRVKNFINNKVIQYKNKKYLRNTLQSV